MTTRPCFRSLPFLLLPLTLLVATGCGFGKQATAQVSGVVTVDGKPLPAGSLVLVGSGSPDTVTIGANGEISTTTAPVGTAVKAYLQRPPRLPLGAVGTAKDAPKNIKMPGPPKDVVPVSVAGPTPEFLKRLETAEKMLLGVGRQYLDGSSTPLTFDFKEGANAPIKVEIKSSGVPPR